MYYFYMGSVLLPIPPEKFSLKVNNANKTLTLINEGEINILRDAGLVDLKFEVLIPAARYSFAMYEGGFKSPSYYLNYFEKLKISKEPFQFIVSRKMPNGRLLFDTNMTVSIEDYNVDEKSKEGFDLVVSISLKQYRPYGTKIVKVIDNVASVHPQREQSNSPAPKQGTTYVVKSGDTLWNIAKRVYGDGSKYTKIYEANKDKITNPNLIYDGQTLVIPDVNSVNAPAVSAPAQTPQKREVVEFKVIFKGVTKYASWVKVEYISGHDKTFSKKVFDILDGKSTTTIVAKSGTEASVVICAADGHSFNVSVGNSEPVYGWTKLPHESDVTYRCFDLTKECGNITIEWVR